MNLLTDKKAVQNNTESTAPFVQCQIRRVSHILKSYSLRLARNDNDAKDLYQDTVFRILYNSEKYTRGTNFKAWAMTIMRNIFINNYNRKARQRTILDDTPNQYFLNTGASFIENEGEMVMRYKELLQILNTLPEGLKRPFSMAYQGFKYHEIAESMNLPIGTIKSRIFIARKKLQAQYKQKEMF